MHADGEDGGNASDLRLDSARVDALQGSLGVAVNQNWPLKAGRRLQAEFAAAWEQQLLGRYETQYASFEASRQVGRRVKRITVDCAGVARNT